MKYSILSAYFYLFIALNECLGQVWFQDVSVTAGVNHVTHGSDNLFVGPMNGGAAWFDIDNDGWDDLYLTGGTGIDKCYKNNGDGTFEDISTSSGIQSLTAGIPTVGVSSADLDRDGYQDLIITTEDGYTSLVLINSGNETFSEEASSRGIIHTGFSAGVTMGDYNQDGWLDLYFTNWRDFSINPPFESGHPDNLYLNLGNGSFTDVTVQQSMFSDAGCGLAAAFSDYDLDGDADLLLGNDFGEFSWADGNRLFKNNAGTFVDETLNSSFSDNINSMGIATGDFDEDQDFDYYITNINSNLLLRNDGGVFSSIAETAGVTSQWTLIDTAGIEEYDLYESWSWGTMFFDYDNDTYVDLFVNNGIYVSLLAEDEPEPVDENRLYRNQEASGTFQDVSVISGMSDGGMFRGCAKSDFDRDGDLDVVLVQLDSLSGFERTMLMRNEVGNQQNWLELELNGSVSNLDAIGSVVRLYVDGRVLLRETDSGGTSYLSHHSKVVHYGLGSYDNVDSINVVWPNGNSDTYLNVEANQRLSITEGNNVLVGQSIYDSAQISLYPNPASEILYCSGFPNQLKPDGYRIFGLSSGRIISVNEFNEYVDVKGLENGLYCLEFIYKGPEAELTSRRFKFAVVH